MVFNLDLFLYNNIKITNYYYFFFVLNNFFIYFLFFKYYKFLFNYKNFFIAYNYKNFFYEDYSYTKKYNLYILFYILVVFFFLKDLENTSSFFLSKDIIYIFGIFILVLNFFLEDINFFTKTYLFLSVKIKLIVLLLFFQIMLLLFTSLNLVYIYVAFEILSFLFLLLIFYNIFTYKNFVNEELEFKEVSSFFHQILVNFYTSVAMLLYIIYLITMEYWFFLDLDYLFYWHKINNNIINNIENLHPYIFILVFFLKLGMPPFMYYKYNIYNEMFLYDLFLYNLPFFFFFFFFFLKNLFLLILLDFNNILLIFFFILLIISILFLVYNLYDFKTDKEILLFSSYLNLYFYLLMFIFNLLFTV